MVNVMKWALVLSGGGALGLAHLGVIKVLEREKLTPHMIVGTSMGAIIGALWATGHSAVEMEEIALSFNISDYMEGITHKIPFDNSFIKFLQAEEALGTILSKRGVNNGIKVRNYLNELYEGKSFQETDIPFYCNAVDLLTGHEMIMNDGTLADGVYASMAYPGFFEPLDRAEELLCDGSVQNNFPVWIARQFGSRRVIGIDVGYYKRIASSDMDNGLSVILRSFQTACQTQRRTRKDKATVRLHLRSPRGNSFDFNDNSSLIRAGEEAAEKWLKTLKTAIYSPIIFPRTIET